MEVYTTLKSDIPKLNEIPKIALTIENIQNPEILRKSKNILE